MVFPMVSIPIFSHWSQPIASAPKGTLSKGIGAGPAAAEAHETDLDVISRRALSTKENGGLQILGDDMYIYIYIIYIYILYIIINIY